MTSGHISGFSLKVIVRAVITPRTAMTYFSSFAFLYRFFRGLLSKATFSFPQILGNLPTVYLHLSVCKLQSLRAVLDSLTRPEAQPTSNLASSILSATPPGLFPCAFTPPQRSCQQVAACTEFCCLSLLVPHPHTLVLFFELALVSYASIRFPHSLRITAGGCLERHCLYHLTHCFFRSQQLVSPVQASYKYQ